MRLRCTCDPTTGQSCRVCEGAEHAAEMRRDWPDEDDLRATESRYERHLWSDR